MKWISVKSNIKPKNEQQVWLNMSFNDGEIVNGYGIYNEVDDDFFVDVDNCELVGVLHAYEYGCEIASVTHWMPLPEPPKD